MIEEDVVRSFLRDRAVCHLIDISRLIAKVAHMTVYDLLAEACSIEEAEEERAWGDQKKRELVGR